MTELTHYINFHNEGSLAIPAISSALSAKKAVDLNTNNVKVVAILDKAEDFTKHLIYKCDEFDDVLETQFGDLGSARNFAALSGNSEFLSFQDGDDLIGDQWLKNALAYIITSGDIKNRLIMHPEYALYFYEREFDIQFKDIRKSFFMRYTSSTTQYLDPKIILFNNIYTSNFMSSRELLLENRLPEVDKDNNWGIEDWSWNSLTLARGMKHEIVPNTVHAVRVKEDYSLGLENARKNLLPDTREYIEKVINANRQ